MDRRERQGNKGGEREEREGRREETGRPMEKKEKVKEKGIRGREHALTSVRVQYSGKLSKEKTFADQ